MKFNSDVFTKAVQNQINQSKEVGIYDITYKGIVTSVPLANTKPIYSVRIKNITYTNIYALKGLSISIGDTVLCEIPQGVLTNMYIKGVLQIS